ncbi:MAG: OstA-like protein [Prevotellaceae bacterium]|nr:OstA-like protein [Prevotellaceae bacterium]
MVLCLFVLCLLQVAYAAKPVKKAQKNERVYLIHSDELYYDMYGKNPDAQIVKGNVRFMHQGGYLNCDSAYFYQQQNSVRAMGHVHFTQGDTLSLTCERGFYDGQMQMMEARKNVVLKHRKQTLYTDSLNYDRIWENAYFYDGGKLIDGKDVLVADWGSYNTATKKAVFYYHVVMTSEGQRVETDTLHYDTETSLAHVLGPSVVTKDSMIINTQDGYFDSKSDKSQLYGRSTVINGNKTITGDSLFYNSDTGDAEGYGKVVYVDVENKNELYGDYLQYNEKTGYGYATLNALVKDYSQKDTLYMHGDSIKLFTYNIDTDSVYRKVHCYNKVRAYREDFQAICDSLVGDSRDSCMVMYKDPIVWNLGRQVLGEVIRVYSNDSTIREAHIIGQALSVERCDEEDHYNQISSNEIDAFFTEGALRHICCVGNVKVIYYPVDENDSTLMLLNYTETDTLRTYMSEDRQLEKIWTSKHVSDMYPMTQIPPEKYKLPEFAWFEELRPVDKDDVFNWRGKKDEEKLKSLNNAAPPMQTLRKSAAEPAQEKKEETDEEQPSKVQAGELDKDAVPEIEKPEELSKNE